MMKPHNLQRTIKCVNCSNGKVRYTKIKKEVFRYKKKDVEVSDIMMWQCDNCGEIYFDEESTIDLDKKLEEEYNKIKEEK